MASKENRSDEQGSSSDTNIDFVTCQLVVCCWPRSQTGDLARTHLVCISLQVEVILQRPRLMRQVRRYHTAELVIIVY